MGYIYIKSSQIQDFRSPHSYTYSNSNNWAQPVRTSQHQLLKFSRLKITHAARRNTWGFDSLCRIKRNDFPFEDLSKAEGLLGAIFVNATQFGDAAKARELSDEFFDTLNEFPPGSINSDTFGTIANAFGNLGSRVPGLFGSDSEGRRGAKRARSIASDGRTMTSDLKFKAEKSQEECQNVDGLTDGERLELAGLAARANYVDTTYGSFYRGVVLGSR